MEKKVRAIEEKLKKMEGSNAIWLNAAKMCLVYGVRIHVKFKVPNFEKYKRASDPRMHIRSYCQKMVAYSDDDRLLMHFSRQFERSLDWYIQLEGTTFVHGGIWPRLS